MRYCGSVLVYCFRCWRARPQAWLASVLAVSALLSVAATAQLGFVLGERSLSRQLATASQLQVFLKDGASPAQVQSLEASLRSVPGVRGLTYRSKAQALSIAKGNSDLSSLAQDSQGNPFPASLVVNLADPRVAAAVNRVAVQSTAIDPTVPTSYTPRQAQQLSSALAAARIVVLAVTALALLLAALVGLVLMRSEMRSRRAELRILDLVSVPAAVIRLPLFIEAISIAVVSSLAASLVLDYVAGHVLPLLNAAVPFLQLGNPWPTVLSLSLLTLASSAVTLGLCSLAVRLPR